MGRSESKEDAPSAVALADILNRAAFEQHLCAHPNTRVARLSGQRMNSAVYYVESNAFPTPAVVKLYLNPTTRLPQPELAKRQFTALTRASLAMHRETGYRVSQPYLLLESESLVAAEWIPGDTLTARLTRWFAPLRELKQDLRQSALWLAKLHRALAAAPGPLDSLQREEILSEWASSRPCKDGLPKRALDMLRESAPDAARQPLNRCALHGDFKPDNVLLTPGSTAGIDIELRHENCAVYDLAAFLNHLDILCHEPSGWRLYPVRKRLQMEFLESYYEKMNMRSALPLLWIRLYLLLSSRIDGHRSRFAVVQEVISDSVIRGALREWAALR